jgi:hypothetical protein
MALCAFIVLGTAGILSSCGKKEETPAQEIEQGTMGMEKKIETLKEEVKEKASQAKADAGKKAEEAKQQQ